MKKQTLEISGEFFQSGYAVYIVEITRGNNKYFYVGQTGDAHYIMARSPFYRMSGHFEYRKSTQNQIFEGLCGLLRIEEVLDEKTAKRKALEEFLANATVKYHVFRLHNFEYGSEDKVDHRSKRHNTLVVETALLQLFDKDEDKMLLNKSLVSLKSDPNAEETKWINEIIADLGNAGIKF